MSEDWAHDGWFDADWYASRYAVQQAEAQAHFLAGGYRCGNAPGPFFDTLAYASRSPDWSLDANVDPVTHFRASGSASPHHLYHPRFLGIGIEQLAAHYPTALRRLGLRTHPLLYPREASLEAILTSGKPIASAPLFDDQWYRQSALDTAVEDTVYHDPLHYFLVDGIFAGQVCHREFDSQYYRSRYRDQVSRFFEQGLVSDFEHWLCVGVSSGLNPNAFFDAAYYLERNPQVHREMQAWRMLGAFEHFWCVGMKRGLRASPGLFQINFPEEHARIAERRRRKVLSAYLRERSSKSRGPVPSCSVVIPVHNQVDLTLTLLAELSSQELDVIVVDDGSSDETRRLHTWFPNVKVVRSDEQRGFAAACNLGWRVSATELVCFLNNDMSVPPGALVHAAAAFDDNKVGVVGGRIVRSHGLLQEAGSIVWSDGVCHGFGRDDDPLAPDFAYPRDVDYVSGCLLMTRRSVLETLDGFDEAYGGGYYEDSDYCVRVLGLGLRCVYRPDVLAFHMERASFAPRAPGVVAPHMATNRPTFLARHKEFLRGQTDRKIGMLDLAADRRRGRGLKEWLIVARNSPAQVEDAPGMPQFWLLTDPTCVSCEDQVAVRALGRLSCDLATYLNANTARFGGVSVATEVPDQLTDVIVRWARANRIRYRGPSFGASG